jgi:SAM-dependent methyltransferase
MKSTPPELRSGEIGPSPPRALGAADAAVFETFVVPRYLSLFAERLIEGLVAARDARVCHLSCRTGYPDRELLEKLPNAHVYGCDSSAAAIELARAKARATPGFVSEYRVVEGTTTPFPPGAFSHAFTMHPIATPAERKLLLEELARIVAPRGQALVAMPLRGSFSEIGDLLRECALKNELTALTNAVEAATQLRPTEELFKRELESVGFEYVEVDVRTRTLRFESGRQLFEDPATRLLLLPDLRATLPMPDERAFAYVRDAIDKYWSDGTFELTVNVGVVSGRRRA